MQVSHILTDNNNELLKRRIQHLVDDMGGFDNVQFIFKECAMNKDLMRIRQPTTDELLKWQPTTEELLKFEELLLDQQYMIKHNKVLLEDGKGHSFVVNADSLID